MTSAESAVHEQVNGDTSTIANTNQAPVQDESLPIEEQVRLYELFAEEYFDIVDTLPHDMRRTFALAQQAGRQFEEAKSILKATALDYVSLQAMSIPSMDTQRRLDTLAHTLASHTSDMVRAQQDRYSLMVNMYQWIDRHLHRVDADLVKQHDALAQGFQNILPSTEPLLSSPMRATIPEPLPEEEEDVPVKPIARRSNGAGTGTNSARGRKRASSTNTVPRTGGSSAASRKKHKKRVSVSQNKSATRKKNGEPVDEDEKRYCYCNQISFGEMILCDNPKCPREWFHFGCAGIKVAPKNPWFCRDCISQFRVER